MNYLDLFSGIGGFALGAHMAGMKFQNHFFSEIDPYCVKLYGIRFPDAIALGDIKAIDCGELKDKYGEDWVITGGFPCQDISIAGKGKGLEGERSGLWFEMWRLIRDLRPRVVIAENVGAITFRGLDQILSSLASIGYDSEWTIISACSIGAPHTRERVFIVSYSHGLNVKTRMGFFPKQFRQVQQEHFDAFKKDWLVSARRASRSTYGLSREVDRLRGLGNAIVPQIACLLWRQIKNMCDKEC